MRSFRRFWQANLKLKPEKCFLAGTGSEVLYLGYVMSREGISADVQKVEAVQSFPRPNICTFIFGPGILQSMIHIKFFNSD